MYQICKSCDKTWYYPISDCLFCHNQLETVEPERFEVIGITTVEVPSREHQEVPYHVLLLRDELGNTHTRKTFKEYKRGDQIEGDIELGTPF